MPLGTEARIVGHGHAFQTHIGFCPFDIGVLPQAFQCLRKTCTVNCGVKPDQMCAGAYGLWTRLRRTHVASHPQSTLLLALLQGLGRLKNWRCRHFEFDNKALNGLRKRHMGRQRSEAQQGTGKDNSSHTRL